MFTIFKGLDRPSKKSRSLKVLVLVVESLECFLLIICALCIVVSYCFELPGS